MSLPNDSINGNVTGAVTSGTQGTMKYPSDIDSAPYFMGFHFVKYSRSIASGVRYDPIGNIFLPIPINVSEEFGIEYATAEMGVFGAKGGLDDLKKVGQDMVSALTKRVGSDANGLLRQDTKTMESAGRDLAKVVSFASTMILPEFMKDTAPGRFIAQHAGFVQNPHMTPIFEGVELRKHQFSWVFSPRTPAESNKLEEVMNYFRLWAHPRFEPNTNFFALQFPYQCYCNFYNTDFLYPVKRAVITSIAIDNGASGQMAFYRGGAPVSVKFSVSLQETEILTSADFEHSNIVANRYNGNYSTDNSNAGNNDQGSSGGHH